jgi:hypothetical protein
MLATEQPTAQKRTSTIVCTSAPSELLWPMLVSVLRGDNGSLAAAGEECRMTMELLDERLVTVRPRAARRRRPRARATTTRRVLTRRTPRAPAQMRSSAVTPGRALTELRITATMADAGGVASRLLGRVVRPPHAVCTLEVVAHASTAAADALFDGIRDMVVRALPGAEVRPSDDGTDAHADPRPAPSVSRAMAAA